MKYLKRIFERFSDDDITELKEISENYLVYLLDHDFYLGVDYQYNNEDEVSNYDIIEINVHNPNRPKFGKSLKWDSIKDHIVPFIELLKNKHFRKFRLSRVILCFWNFEDNLYIDSSKLIDDDKETLELLKNKDISCISLQIKRGL